MVETCRSAVQPSDGICHKQKIYLYMHNNYCIWSTRPMDDNVDKLHCRALTASKQPIGNARTHGVVFVTVCRSVESARTHVLVRFSAAIVVQSWSAQAVHGSSWTRPPNSF